jgi:hypothetical protein
MLRKWRIFAASSGWSAFAVIQKRALRSKLKQTLIPMEACWSPRKSLIGREILDGWHFRRSPPRRRFCVSSAAQPIDAPRRYAAVDRRVAFLRHQARIEGGGRARLSDHVP